jgi:hypothetical protein
MHRAHGDAFTRSPSINTAPSPARRNNSALTIAGSMSSISFRELRPRPPLLVIVAEHLQDDRAAGDEGVQLFLGHPPLVLLLLLPLLVRLFGHLRFLHSCRRPREVALGEQTQPIRCACAGSSRFRCHAGRLPPAARPASGYHARRL